MIIEPARREDVVAVAGLEEVLFGVSAWSPALVEAELDHARLVVARDEVVVGYAAWSDSPFDAELLRVGVSPACQGRGTGGLLVEAFIAECEATRLLLEVAEDNAAALVLYRRHRFEEIGRRRRYYADGRDALVMARPGRGEAAVGVGENGAR